MGKITFNYGDTNLVFRQQKQQPEMLDCFRDGKLVYTTSFYSLFYDGKEATEKRAYPKK